MKHFCLIFLRNLLSIYFYRWQNFSTGLSWLWQIRTCWIWWVGAKKVFRNLYHATEKKQVGAQSPWLIQPLPCRWNYHTWTVWSNVSWKCLITLVPVCMKGSHLCFRHLLNHLKENDAQSWVFLIYCSSADERDLSQSSYLGWGFTIWTLSYLSLLNK